MQNVDCECDATSDFFVIVCFIFCQLFFFIMNLLQNFFSHYEDKALYKLC